MWHSDYAMKVKQSIPAHKRFTIEQFNAMFPDEDRASIG